MKLLAVETSGLIGSIALWNDDRIITEESLQSEGRRNAQTMVAQLDALLRTHHLKPADINAVAVSIGPGSFTGLRVGLTFARMFAWANSAALLAVDTLQAVAQQVSAEHPVVAVISDAQRNELFWNEYAFDTETGLRTPLHTVRIVIPEQLDPTVPLCGPALARHAAALTASHLLPHADGWRPTAGAVAHIAASQFTSGQTSDLETLEPVYIRRSYAEEKRG